MNPLVALIAKNVLSLFLNFRVWVTLGPPVRDWGSDPLRITSGAVSPPSSRSRTSAHPGAQGFHCPIPKALKFPGDLQPWGQHQCLRWRYRAADQALLWYSICLAGSAVFGMLTILLLQFRLVVCTTVL